ncbi:adhesive plaque matrix protein-like [Ornithodoros turicata]|uniref:adhesive plaque matrix protein-like n=1 Tax=Ornithodoros turicata TaxID=34597 RepID=UPI0031394CC6
MASPTSCIIFIGYIIGLFIGKQVAAQRDSYIGYGYQSEVPPYVNTRSQYHEPYHQGNGYHVSHVPSALTFGSNGLLHQPSPTNHYPAAYQQTSPAVQATSFIESRSSAIHTSSSFQHSWQKRSGEPLQTSSQRQHSTRQEAQVNRTAAFIPAFGEDISRNKSFERLVKNDASFFRENRTIPDQGEDVQEPRFGADAVGHGSSWNSRPQYGQYVDSNVGNHALRPGHEVGSTLYAAGEGEEYRPPSNKRGRVPREPPWAREGGWIPPGHRPGGPGQGKKRGHHKHGNGRRPPGRPVFEENYPDEFDISTPHHNERPRPQRPPSRPEYPEDSYPTYPEERPHRPKPPVRPTTRPVYPEEPYPQDPYPEEHYPETTPPPQRPRPRPPPEEHVRPVHPRPQPTEPPKIPHDPTYEEDTTDLRELQPLCGVRSLTFAKNKSSDYQTVPFIVGGNITQHSSWPWMAKLQVINPDEVSYRFICGGSLITARYILTAAHCFSPVPERVQNYKIEFFSPRVGQTLERNVEKIVMHEKYSSYSHYYDIAAIRFDRDLLRPFMPICLPQNTPASRQLTNKMAHVIGWGSTKFGGPSSQELRDAEIPIWDNGECGRVFNPLQSQHIDKGIVDAQLCAGKKEGGADACQGDSGGPLMYLDDTRKWTLVGIVSFGHSCAQPGYPGVYTRIPSYMEWIGTHVDFNA